jgi:hypothetical protein
MTQISPARRHGFLVPFAALLTVQLSERIHDSEIRARTLVQEMCNTVLTTARHKEDGASGYSVDRSAMSRLPQGSKSHSFVT